MRKIPEDCVKITINFRLNASELPKYSELPYREEGLEQLERREKHAAKHSGEILVDATNNENDGGIKSGVSTDALRGMSLVRAEVVSKTLTRPREIAFGEEIRIGIPPSLSVPRAVFVFVRDLLPGTHVLGEDARRIFEELFGRGWTSLKVYKNPVVGEGLSTGRYAYDITFARATSLPKNREFGEELWAYPSVRRVINTKTKGRFVRGQYLSSLRKTSTVNSV